MIALYSAERTMSTLMAKNSFSQDISYEQRIGQYVKFAKELLFHDFKHHPCTQPKAVLKYQAIRDGLMLSHTIGILLEQLFLFIYHGGFELFLIHTDQLLYPLEEMPYSVGSILPYQNSSRNLIPHPPHKSFLGG